MTTVVTGRPDKFDRLVHVESLHWFDGEILGHYTLDGTPWLVSLINFRDLTTHYWEAHLYFPVTKENLKKLLANEMTLRDAMELASERWRVEAKWEHLPNGHGVPNTNVDTWCQTSWEQFPDEEKPSTESYINFDLLSGRQ